jgi:hypothetical protein
VKAHVLDQLAALVVDEGKWLPGSIALAALAAGWRLRGGDGDPPLRPRIEAALTLFFAVMIGMMAFGHLAAVTTKLALGTLDGSLLTFYGIGAALAAPSWWLAIHGAGGTLPPTTADAATAVRLTIWLAVTLLAMGPQNLPLAAPALFALAYRWHARPAVGWAIVSLSLVATLGLFIGALVFMASGQTFEQFRGID